MTFKSLSLAGLGVLGLGAASVGGYAAISSIGGTDSSIEEQAITGIQKLLGKDYTFNPPQFTNYEKLTQGCHENLSKLNRSVSNKAEEVADDDEKKDEDFEYKKLYGCGVAKMDLWDSGDQFGNEKVNYLTFGSEIFFRKGGDAWKISTLIDNHSSGKLIYRHLLSFLDQKSNGYWWTIEAFLIDENIDKKDQKPIESARQEEEGKLTVSVGTQELNIKVPGEAESWFKGANYLVDGPASKDTLPLTKIHKATKEWSGIWVEDSSKPSQGMFQDIEVFIGDKKNSRVFCKGIVCEDGIGSKYQISYQGIRKTAPDTWEKAYYKLIDVNGNKDGNEFLIHDYGPTKAILKFIKDSKGKWSDSNKVCIEKNTEISAEELKELKIFCSKSNR